MHVPFFFVSCRLIMCSGIMYYFPAFFDAVFIVFRAVSAKKETLHVAYFGLAEHNFIYPYMGHNKHSMVCRKCLFIFVSP